LSLDFALEDWVRRHDDVFRTHVGVSGHLGVGLGGGGGVFLLTELIVGESSGTVK
jgi:hypothetical protein